MTNLIVTIKEQMAAVEKIIISMDADPKRYNKEQVEEALILIEEFRFIRKAYDQTYDQMLTIYSEVLKWKSVCTMLPNDYEDRLEKIGRFEIKIDILEQKQDRILKEILYILNLK